MKEAVLDKLKEKYLKNLAKRKKLEAEAGKLAWQIVPPELKEIICGENGIWEKGEEKKYLHFLIEPHWELGHKSPVQAILDGETHNLRRLLGAILYGLHV